MKAKWIEAHAKLLSVPPLFDEATATDLVSSLSDELVEGSSTAPDFLTSLRLTGLLKGESDCLQIADAVRAEFRKSLIEENSKLFQRALNICLDHMQKEFSPTVRRVFGNSNANLLISILELGRKPGERAAFDDVIHQLTEGHRLGRSSGEVIARVALAQLPPTPDRLRQMEFLLGMEAWRGHQRERAERHFDRVLASGVSDLADAISAHLTGVSMSTRDDHANAVIFLQRSIGTLRELHDISGLCQALISLGIAEREISAKLLSEADEAGLDTLEHAALISRADEDFQKAHDALDEAAGLAHGLQNRSLEAGAHLELAVCFARWNDIDSAILESETARSIMSPGDREYLHVLTQLGSFYRRNEDYDNAGEVLGEAAHISAQRGDESIVLARLLNVQAANERRRGNLNAARSHAESSVRIGRRLKDERHLGQALHTLALIAADDAKSPSDLKYAAELLSEGEKILKTFHDSVGLSIVGRTRTYLEGRRAELKGELGMPS